MEEKPKNQLERLLDVLEEIKPDVTAEDKEKAAIKFNIHVRTVGRYLNGLGADSDIAANLIFFFKDRIAQRDKVIA